MKETDIYIKTPAGTDELQARSGALTPRLRTMLIMVDGTATVARLARSAGALGVPEDFLQTLERLGLVELTRPAPAAPDSPADAAAAGRMRQAPQSPAPDDADRFQAALKFMNDSAVDALGLRAFFFTLKLEKCAVWEDLRALLPEFGQIVAKGRGVLIGRSVSEHARGLLG